MFQPLHENPNPDQKLWLLNRIGRLKNRTKRVLFGMAALLAGATLLPTTAIGQTVTIGSTAVPVVAPATGSYFYGPIYRSSAASTFNWSKYAHLYTATELGIPAGSIITNIEWLKSDGGTLTGNNTFEIYLKNTTDGTLTTGTTWGTLVTGATQAYASTTQEFTGAAGSYISFSTAGANFIYSGGNLVVMTDHVKNGTASGVLNFVTNPAAGLAIGNASGTALTSTSTLVTGLYGDRRPTIRITYTGASPCTGTPAPGNTIASASAVCAGQTFTLSPQNITGGSGVTYQWQSSPDGLTWTNIGSSSPSLSTSQTAATFYQLQVTCGGATGTTTPVQITMNSFLSCYCTSSATSAADTELLNVTFGSLNNTSTCTTTGGPGSVQSMYSNYTTTVTPPGVMQGQTAAFSANVGTCGGNFNKALKVFIDFNQNGLLTDAGEEALFLNAPSTAPQTLTGNITIPITAIPGNTLMRVVLVESGTATSIVPCGTYTWGETEDYFINIVQSAACSGTPDAGTTPASLSACIDQTVTINATGSTIASGFTYQWQQSTNGGTTWVPAVGGSGANSLSYTTPPINAGNAGIMYRLESTCTGSGLTDVTNATTVTNGVNASCYCISSATSASWTEILNVYMGTLDNTSTCSTTGGPGSVQSMYSNYTNVPSVPVPTFMQTQTAVFEAMVGSCTTDFAKILGVFIDFNQNGVLTDPGEQVYLSPATTTPQVLSSNITIPLTALPGTTLMRVVLVETSTPSAVTPCGTYLWGETEDYFINIVAATPCAGIPNPGSVTASVADVCTGTSFELNLTGQTIAVGIGVQWQVSTDGINFTNISGATSSQVTVSQTASSFYRAEVTCDGANPAYTSAVQVTSPLPFPAGVYTINSTLATGGSNFQSFTDAVNAISCGISGAVTFNVVSGTGPYNEQISIPQVGGAGPTSRITFNGNGETIAFASANTDARHVIKLNGADYVTFDELVVNASAGTFGFGIHLTNNADNNEILNSTINSSLASTSTNYAGIVFSGTNISATSAGNTGDNNLISGNIINGGYYGISMVGESATTQSVGNQIVNNTLNDAYLYNMYLFNQEDMLVSTNEMSRPTRTSLTTFYGIYMSGIEGILVEKNRIHDPFTTNTASTSLFGGIYMFGSNVGAGGTENRFENNIIYNVNSNGTQYGIYNSASGGANFYHNTIALNSTASTAGTTYGFYQITAPADQIEFVNNIVTVTRGGTGAKYNVYISAATAPVVSNYNVLYMNSAGGTNNNIGYNGTARPTLTDWQGQGFDLNSTDENPMFTNAATGDLTPTSQFADNIGTPVGVLEDINLSVRSTTMPDPGAFEFSVFVACPAPLGLNAVILNSVSAELAWNVAGTLGEFNLEYGPQGFTPGTGNMISALMASPYIVTGLTPGTCYEFYVYQDCGPAGVSVTSGPRLFCTPACTVAAIAGRDSYCFSGTPALSLPGTTQQGTFQWQVASSATGPFTNIPGATASTYTASAPITTTTYYQAVVDCGTGPQTTPVFEVEVSSPQITATNTPITLCAPGQVTLSATASAGDVKWYDVATGGTALATGNTFTPNVTGTTTYYAEASTGTTQFVGRLAPQAGAATVLTTYGQDFTLTSALTLNSVDVISTTGTSITISLFNAAGTTQLMTTGPVTVPTNATTAIPLNWNLTPGTYRIVANGMVGNFIRENTTVTYPIALGSFGQINGFVTNPNSAINTSSSYYFMYNWSVTTGCESPRVAVQVTVDPVNAIMATATQTTICAGEMTTLTVSNPQTGVDYTWTPGGMTGTSAMVSPTATQTYTVTGSNAAGCSATAEVTVTVNPTPVAGASSNSPVMQGDNLILAASGGTTYSWVGPNGFSSASQTPAPFPATPADAGDYTVFVSDGTCTSSAIVTVSVILPQPLNGTYTINQTAPASATNFVSFPAAATWLNTLGVSGPVTINVVAGTSPYMGQQFLLTAIPGASATNTITINGNGETINHCPSTSNTALRSAIRLDGTDFVTLKDMTVNSSNCPFAWGLHLMNGADNNTFENNTFNMSTTSMTIGGTVGIVASNSTFDPTLQANAANNLTLNGNTVNGGYHGIRINGVASAPSTGLMMDGNTITNAYTYGLYIIGNNNPVVKGTTVSMRSGNVNSIGIVIQQVQNGMELSASKVTNAGRMGAYLNQINQASTTRGLIANNMFAGGYQNTAIADGLQLNFASHLDVYYNSIWTDNGAIGSGLNVSNIFSQGLNLKNNSFAFTGANGYALQANNGNSNFLSIDNNNYYTTGGKFVRFAGADRPNLSALQTAQVIASPVHDMQSMSNNPLYVSNTDLHLQAGSPLINGGTAIVSVTTDYDGATRTNPTDIGADEYGVLVRQAAELTADVYPNPFHNKLVVKVTGETAGQVQLVLTDLMGRQVLSRTFGTEGGTTSLELNVDQEIAQGVYLLQVTQGDATAAFRVVKQ